MAGAERVSPAWADEDLAVPGPAAGGARVVTDLRRSLTLRMTEEGGGRVRAAVYGEVDFDSAPTLRHVLEDSLRHAPGGLDLDLSGVGFIDCSGLRVLIHLRRTARERNTPLRLLSPSYAVARLLALTGTGKLLLGRPGRAALSVPTRIR